MLPLTRHHQSPYLFFFTPARCFSSFSLLLLTKLNIIILSNFMDASWQEQHTKKFNNIFLGLCSRLFENEFLKKWAGHIIIAFFLFLIVTNIFGFCCCCCCCWPDLRFSKQELFEYLAFCFFNNKKNTSVNLTKRIKKIFKLRTFFLLLDFKVMQLEINTLISEKFEFDWVLLNKKIVTIFWLPSG